MSGSKQQRKAGLPLSTVRWQGMHWLALILSFALSSCEKGTDPSNGVLLGEFRQVDDFSFTTQLDREMSRDELKGKIWIANFIFTSCTAECLVLSARIAELQMHLRDYDDVAFVSFSVDPQTDTPDRLRTFASRWHADSERWHFLTGDTEAMDDLVVESFLLPVTRDPIEAGKLYSESLIHTNRIAVVDYNGQVRAYVDGLSPDSVNAIIRIVVQLREESGSPSIDSP